MQKSIKVLLSLFLTTWLAIGFTKVSAQEKTSKSKLDISADIMSRYIWRGRNLGGASPSIQPNLKYSFGNFAIGAWGAYSLSHAITQQETDLYASYTIASLVSITATDFFFTHEDSLPNHYFNYNEDKTGHVIEVSAKFLGTEEVPISLMVATNVYGADPKKLDGDNMYSTYIELGYSFKVKENSCNAFLGFTTNKPKTEKGESGYYGNGPGVVNLGITAIRNIRITDSFSLPLSASLITNPQAENIFLVFGISL